MRDLKPQLDILLAESDEDDYLLFLEAIRDSGQALAIKRVRDGQELVDFFLGPEKKLNSPVKVIIVDIKMPRLSGIEAIAAIRLNSELQKIPIIVFSGSCSPVDIDLCYSLGVNSFHQKPISYEGWVQFVKTVRSNCL
ncbi:MAG: response regulator [Nitrospina sp.]|nr:response regulator [Nitrospina sp.]